MTQWGLDTLFNPAKRHMDEEKQRLQSTREEVGDSSGGKRIDLESGKVTINKATAEGTGETEGAEDAGTDEGPAAQPADKPAGEPEAPTTAPAETPAQARARARRAKLAKG